MEDSGKKIDSWFDGQGIELAEAAIVERGKNWKKYVEDGRVSEDEIREQKAHIDDLLRALEPKLNPEIHRELTSILIEFLVLIEMYERVVTQEDFEED